MALIFPEEPKKEPKKFGFFFKISMIFLIIGAVLHGFNWMFWGELSYFACCTIITVGIVYIILHHITYLTGKKIERVISLFFYTGIACLILKMLSSLISKEDYYVDISPFMEVHDIVISGLEIGIILLPLSVVIMLLKYNKLFKFIMHFF